MSTTALPVLRGRPPVADVATAGRSRMIEKYLASLAKCERPRVLDIGPLSGKNVSFFLERVDTLCVCDVMRRLDAATENTTRLQQVVTLLDYRRNSFDGINLWDAPDHLDGEFLSLIVRRCYSLLRPQGLILMIAGNATVAQPFQRFWAIDDTLNVALKQGSHCGLPYFHRENREIQKAMMPLEPYCSFVCMNGIREFLFRRAY